MIKMFISGNLTKDASVFNYGDGKSGVSFDIASNDYGSEKPEYMHCVMFNRDESFANSLKRGNQIIASGRYTKNEEGYVSCIIDNFEFGRKAANN